MIFLKNYDIIIIVNERGSKTSGRPQGACPNFTTHTPYMEFFPIESDFIRLHFFPKPNVGSSVRPRTLKPVLATATLSTYMAPNSI